MKPEILIAGLACAFFAQQGLAQPEKAGPNDTAPAAAKAIAIVGGKLLTVSHGTIEDGTVVFSGGKIVAVGPAKSTRVPAGAEVFDAKGMTVYPGLFDAETQLGLTEVASDQNNNDLVETADEVEPQMHVADRSEER